MLYDWTSNLVDPTPLGETNLPALKDVIGLRAGEVTLTVDPTIRKPVRIKPRGLAAYEYTAQRDVENTILTLNACFAPFSVMFLKANVSADGLIWPVDLTTCVSTLQLMYRCAQKSTDLSGHKIVVELSISLPAEPNSKLRPSVSCALAGSAGQDRAKAGAIAEYRAAVESLWSKLVQSILGDWVRENGIREFRLAGEIPVDPRLAVAAANQPRPAPITSAA